MSLIISLAVAFTIVIALCLLVLRRRSGSGERGALERSAAEQGFAHGLGEANGVQQNMGPGGS